MKKKEQIPKPVAKWRYTGESQWRDYYEERPQSLASGNIEWNWSSGKPPKQQNESVFPGPTTARRLQTSQSTENWWEQGGEDNNDEELVTWS